MHETSRRVSFNADYLSETGQGFTGGTCYSYQFKRIVNQVIRFDLISAHRGGQTHGAGSQRRDSGSPAVPNLVLGKDWRPGHSQDKGIVSYRPP
jgi:hypothetical protein